MEAYREDLSARLVRPYRVFQNNSRLPRHMVRAHWHEAYEILYIRRGWGKQRINARETAIHPGNIIVIAPNDIHATEAQASEGMDVDVLQFTDGLLSRTRETAYLASAILHPAEDQRFPQLFDALKQYTRTEGPGQEMLMMGLLQLVIAFLLRSGQGESAPKQSGIIQEICAYMETAPDLRLEQIAAHFGYCPEHLSRKFHAEMGISYRFHCDLLRMRRAAMMLHQARGSISAVAERLGYSDDSSFIRAFKRLYGITPSAYKRLCLPMDHPNLP